MELGERLAGRALADALDNIEADDSTHKKGERDYAHNRSSEGLHTDAARVLKHIDDNQDSKQSQENAADAGDRQSDFQKDDHVRYDALMRTYSAVKSQVQ